MIDELRLLFFGMLTGGRDRHGHGGGNRNRGELSFDHYYIGTGLFSESIPKPFGAQLTVANRVHFVHLLLLYGNRYPIFN